MTLQIKFPDIDFENDIFDLYKKSPSLNVCKKINWEKLSNHRCWVDHNGRIGTYSLLEQTLVFEKHTGVKVICSAPTFCEIFKQLPSYFKLITGLSTENENKDCEGFFTMDHEGIGYFTEDKGNPIWLEPNYISFESVNGNIAQAAGLLLIAYQKMKKQWENEETYGIKEPAILTEIFYPEKY